MMHSSWRLSLLCNISDIDQALFYLYICLLWKARLSHLRVLLVLLHTNKIIVSNERGMDWNLTNTSSVSTQKTIGKEGRRDRRHRAPAGVPPEPALGSWEPSVRPGDWAGQSDQGTGGGEGRRGSPAGECQPFGSRQRSPECKHVVLMLVISVETKEICIWLRAIIFSRVFVVYSIFFKSILTWFSSCSDSPLQTELDTKTEQVLHLREELRKKEATIAQMEGNITKLEGKLEWVSSDICVGVETGPKIRRKIGDSFFARVMRSLPGLETSVFFYSFLIVFRCIWIYALFFVDVIIYLYL